MSTEAMEIIKQTVVNNTILDKDQIVIAQPGRDHYSRVYVIKNNRIIDIGQICYDAYIIRDVTTINKALLLKFGQMASECFNGNLDRYPILYGNQAFLSDEFLEVIKIVNQK